MRNRIFLSVRWRIVAAFLGVTIAAFSLLYIITINSVEQYFVSGTVNKALTDVDILSVEASALFAEGDADALYSYAVEEGRQLNGRIMFLGSQGVVQVDGFSQLNGTLLTNKEVRDIVDNGMGSSWGLHDLSIDNEEENWALYCAAPIFHSGSYIGTTLLSIPVNDLVQSIDSLKNTIMLLFLVSTLVVFFAIVSVSNILVSPIKEFSKGIGMLSQGDYSNQITVSGNNEFSQLADTFNTMSYKLQNIEHMRNEFVSNASHEMKTPLTTIKILVDTLKHGDFPKEVADDFYDDMSKEIDRMSTLISDLLMLVRMGETEENYDEYVDMSTMVLSIINNLSVQANSRGISIKFDATHNLFVKGNEVLLTQMIVNLVENAIKYSEDGGRVEVKLWRDMGMIHVNITDDGIGISQEDIRYIFDRFYRVDKARSRDTGGTGLGLSIVKTTVRAHGGSIDVKSKLGVGTTFIVQLPEAVN